MASKNLKIILIFLGILVIGNLIFLDWQWVKGKDKGQNISREAEIESGERSKTKAADDCGPICQQTIAEKINEELSRLPSPAGQSSISPPIATTTPTPVNGKPKIVYIPLVTEGLVASASWTDIVPSEFYFDLASYPGAREVHFEAYLLSSNNDLVEARIYDNTNKRAVDFSELQTKNSTFTRVESSALVIWRGNNKYTVQLRSVNGTQVQLKDARLKILY